MMPQLSGPGAPCARVAPTLILTLLVTASCSSFRETMSHRTLTRAATHPSPTLLVVNRTGTNLAVRVGDTYVGRATPGRNCFDLTTVPRGGQVVEIAPAGHRPVRSLRPEVLRSEAGWRLTLQSPALVKYDMIVQPAPPCRTAAATRASPSSP